MKIWWLVDFRAKIKDHKYLKIEFTYYFFIILLSFILWPSQTLNLNRYSVPDLFLIFAILHFLFLLYLTSVISSGNLLSEKEFKIINLAKYSSFSTFKIVIGRALSILLYLCFLFILLLPFNLLINFSFPYSILRILYLYLMLLLDAIPVLGLGILWSTFQNPSLSWFLHWSTYVLFIIFPFLFPKSSFFFPLNNILWLVKAENILYVNVVFNPKIHIPIIIFVYLLIFLVSILIAQKRLKYYKGDDKE